MVTLNDEMIFSDFKNKIIDNFLEMPMALFSVIFYIMIVTAILIVYIVIKRKFSYKINLIDFAIIPSSFFIAACINLICIFGLRTCYEYYLDTHLNELNWTISTETVSYKEDVFVGGRYGHRYIYNLYFNQEQENNNSNNNTNKIKVKEDIFYKVKEGEKCM